VAFIYVRDELQQRPWLAYRLTEYVFEEAWTRATGIRRVHIRPSYMDDSIWGPRARPFRFVFEARDGETLDEVKRRFNTEVAKARANLQASEDLPKGLLQKEHEWKTRRNVRWLYRNQMCGEKLYQIAKAYHEEHRLSYKHRRFSSCPCDDLVSKGIKNAQVLLNLTAYRF
jgi:hypothetical protein